MSYSFPKNSPNGEEVTLENGVTYKYNSIKKSWEILDAGIPTQTSSSSPVMLNSGWDKKYNFVSLKSLNEREMSGTSLLATGALSTSIFLFRAYKQSGGQTKVLYYDRTEDSMIEVWEWNSGDNIPILRAGIKEIKQSSYSEHDSELLLSKFWAKPGYNFSTSRYYTFVLHGLVEKPTTA